MSLLILNPTAFTSPDGGFGGDPVTSPTNTGHAATEAFNENGDPTTTKSCRWHTFQLPIGQKKSVTLKVTHTSSGTLSGVGANNQFDLEYSLNGGGAWISIVSRSNFTVSQGPTTFSVSLSLSQDISQVMVRDRVAADTNDPGESASATATISGISIEVETVPTNVVVMI